MSTEILDVRGIKVANIKNYSDIVFFGIGVLAGSNYETPEIAGIAHFGEHLFFKGTEKQNWKQLNEEFAKLGIEKNAYTSNNEVLYHATCPKENLESTIEFMLDMFFNSTMPPEEMEKERNVIKEEKKMSDDDPKMVFASAVGNNFFNWTVGHDTIGTNETIQNITRKNIIDYLRDKTTRQNIVFICCGDISSDDLKRYIEKNIPKYHVYLRDLASGLNNTGCTSIWTDLVKKPDNVKFILEKENITQSSAYMILNALAHDDPMYYPERILYAYLGGGSYSRLFSRIRDELGLCYSVGMCSLTLDYPQHQIGNIYGYLASENIDRFMLESEKICQDTMKNGLNKDVFECAKTDYLSSLLRVTETSAGKAHYLSRKFLFYKNTSVSMEESVKNIRNVTIEDCNDVAKISLNNQYNWAIMISKKRLI